MRISDFLRRIIRHDQKPIEPRPSSTPKVAAPAFVQVVPAEGANDHGVPRYPPIDSGISIATVEELLSSQKDLIDTLRRNVGIPDHEFEFKYLGPLRRAAAVVNLLPATRDKHHTGAGGLFRFCVSMAVRSDQSANGKMFAASESVEKRRTTENAWRHAAFLAGLTCELFRPFTEMIIVDSKGNQWGPFISSLSEWAAENKADRFFVRWHSRDSARDTTVSANTMSSWAVNAVCGDEVLNEIHSVKPKIVEAIFGVASGTIGTTDSSLAALIAEVRRRVIEQDNSVSPITYGKLTSGVHLEPYFLDAMRSLVSKGVWQINAKGSRCHWGADGFYVAWRTGSTELLAHLESQKIQGVPTNRETLEEMLGKAGIITVAPDGSWVHLVHPSSGTSSPIPAIRLQSPTSILGHVEAKPVTHNLRAAAKKLEAVAEVKTDTAATAKPKKVPPKAPAQTVGQAASDDNSTPVEGSTSSESTDNQIVPTTAPAETPAKPDPNVDKETGEITFTTGGGESTADVADAASMPGPTAAPVESVKGSVPRGGIPTVPDVELSLDDGFDKDLRLTLGDPICREILVWRDSWNRGQQRKYFLKTSDGLAISQEILTAGTISITTVVEALKDNGYLVIKVVSGRDRSMQQFPFEGKQHLGICLTNTLLRKAGFVLE